MNTSKIANSATSVDSFNVSNTVTYFGNKLCLYITCNVVNSPCKLVVEQEN